MSGLLSKIGNALQSPTAQGLLMAGATGFNPLLGLLAAPAIASGREREELRNEQSREDIRGKRQANDARARQQTALGQIPGLLRSAPPQLLDPSGDGLLAQPGAEQTFQQRQASILSQAAPEQFTQGLLGQMFPQGDRAPPSDARMMQMLGYDMTPEGFQRFQKDKSDGNLDEILKGLQIKGLLGDRGREAQERAVQEQVETVSVNELVNKGQNVIKRARKLEGTFLEPGAFGIQGRRPLQALVAEGAHMVGAAEWANARRSEIDDYDKFVKDSTDIVISLTNRFGTNPTNLQTRMLQDASAGTGISPAAIVSVTSEMLERTLREADARGQQIEGREEIEALLNEYRGLTGGPSLEDQGAASMGAQIPGFDELSPAEQQELLQHMEGLR